MARPGEVQLHGATHGSGPEEVDSSGPLLPHFDISAEDLNDIVEHKNIEALDQAGGVIGLAARLASSCTAGINPAAGGATGLEERRAVYGANKFRDLPQKAFFQLLFENLQDPTLIMLMVAALVSTVLGAALKQQREEKAWTEGVAIWVAVLVVSLVGAGNDYQKDLQFKKLNAQKDVIEVKVIRSRQEMLVLNTELVVGDLMVLDTGDKVAADGLLVEHHGLVIDEASLTGESEPLKKGERDPWVLSGTQVTEGSGSVLVLGVGEHSEWGRTMALVRGETGETPLQVKLGALATAIGKLGLLVGVCAFLVLMLRWMIVNKGFPGSQFASGPLNFFIFGVTIVVVAVPEGLPLAVTISLAYSMKKMMRDNNFVRVLAACETMGGATAICSDKTGTLTENRMTVVEGWFAGRRYGQVPAASELPGTALHEIQMNIALNSKAFLIEHDEDLSSEKTGVEFVGNRTECALLMLMRGWGAQYQACREEHHASLAHIYGFSSEKKMASVLCSTDTGFRLYNKGAAEIVLAHCWRYVDPSGVAAPLTPEVRDQLATIIIDMASKGLRTLCLSYADYPAEDPARPADFFETPPDDDLTALCIVGIKDPVRREVPDAVATCKRAGITVRMVTGDNVHTAEHIARECGILMKGGLALEGPAFRKMTDPELLPLLPNLQVLARSSPTDKYKLVQLLKRQGEVVAVTGDGTNDAPALKESDVGLAMGIAGTEVAKEAADIVILDDNFSSIVKSVLWGRSVFDNIRKFLQFQLTVNASALVIAFVAAVGSGQTPLNVLQLLWLNLIMDALAALALATEPPTPELLLRKPHGRDEPLINRRMWRNILVQGLYQIFWVFLIFYGLPGAIKKYEVPTQGCTLDYNSYISYAGVEVNQLPSNTQLAGIPTYDLHDGNGPRVDTCCILGSDCLTTDTTPGWYTNASEVICQYTRGGPVAQGALAPATKVTEPSKQTVCGSAPSQQCSATFTVLQRLSGQAQEQWRQAQANGRAPSNSLLFNAYIFMQLFNEFNSRRLDNAYNVFKGILHSPVFLGIWVVCVLLQVLIIELLGSFFKVVRQGWEEWLIAVAIGAGSLPLAVITKFVARRFEPAPPDMPHSTSLGAVHAL